MNAQTPKKKQFKINVKRISPQQAVAETHGQKITLAIQGKDPNLGFTAPEAVLAAFGACILSNVTKGATEMGLKIEDASIEFSALKRWALKICSTPSLLKAPNRRKNCRRSLSALRPTEQPPAPYWKVSNRKANWQFRRSKQEEPQ